MDSDITGNLYAVVSEYDPATALNQVWTSICKYSLCTGYTPELLSGTANGTEPWIAADPYGDVVAVWLGSSGGTNGIWGNRIE